MRNLLIEIDRLLMQINVSGDDVFVLAEARAKLKKVFEYTTEDLNGEQTDK